MLRSVLVVVDSACVSRVVGRVAKLPLASDATVTIAEVRGDARSLLWELHGIGLVARCRRIRWTPSDAYDSKAVIDLVHKSGAELVVFGAPGRFCRRIGPLIGRVPVLVTRSTSSDGYRRPLVAIEPSGRAHDILGFLRRLFPEPPAMSAVHVCAAYAERSRRLVASILASVGSFGAGWTRYIESGDVRTNIVETAAVAHADLVVVGTRPRTALGRLMFGSVTRGVFQDVACDVLAIPAPDRAPAMALPHALSGLR